MYPHLLAITSFRFELITKYILFACEQWHFEMGWTAYQLWCYSVLWAIVSSYDNGSTHNNNNNKKLSTEWLMNALSIHLSVSIRANRIKIYCKHYTQNTTFNYISHIRCDANITMVEHRRKKRIMGKIHASFCMCSTRMRYEREKNGTSTEMIECIAHSGSILQMKYWRIYVIDILSVSKWKVDANVLHLWVWSSFCWTMCMNMFILFYFRFNFASPWKWISFHIAFDPSNLMNGYMKKKSTAQINLLFIQRCVQWNVIQLEKVIQRVFL